jgi:hypothetical protein
MSDIKKPKGHGRSRQLQLRRGLDGRLRSSDEEADIGDLWAQQKRIRLAEAVEEDKKKASRQQLLKERGIVGVAGTELTGISTKVKVGLFGERAKKKPKPQKTARAQKKSKQQHKMAPAVNKTVEINIAMPSLPNATKAFRQLNPMVWMSAIKNRAKKPSRKLLIVYGAVLLVAGLTFGGYHFFSDRKTTSQNQSTAKTTGNAGKTAQLQQGTPEYATILPAGKNINQLGGWYRVSPPGKNPVYAYVDKLDGVPIDVSEQPLPPSFQTNTASHVSQLAKGYGANEKLDLSGGNKAYVGTSAEGTQSLIMTKANVLVLIKSSTPLTVNQWAAYVNALR